MRTLAGIGALTLGALGILLCATAVGVGWWTTARSVNGVDRVVARVDTGLAEINSRLARVESRAAAIRVEVEEVRNGGEALLENDLELPRVRAAVDELLDRLGPPLDRAEAVADSMRSVAAALRAAADSADQLADAPEAGTRARNAADAIDRAAEALNALLDRVEGLKQAETTRLVQGVVELTREAVAGIDLLADGLAMARVEISDARAEMTGYRNYTLFRIYAVSAAGALALAWAGLGQLCLLNWGRRQRTSRSSAPAAT
jgi:chromosome segregation ATPase